MSEGQKQRTRQRMLETTKTEKKRNRVEGGQSEENKELKQGSLEELSVDHKWLDYHQSV